MENDKNTDETLEKKKPSKIIELIKKQKAIFVLLLVIIALLVYHLIKVNMLENEYTEQTVLLKKEYALKIDSLKLAYLQQTVKVFSWAVRSEMKRNNLEEVNDFFLNFVKENGIRMISLINSDDANILLSTDKKNEGQLVTDRQILNVNEVKVLSDSVRIEILAPIMGLDKKIAVLSVEVTK